MYRLQRALERSLVFGFVFATVAGAGAGAGVLEYKGVYPFFDRTCRATWRSRDVVPYSTCTTPTSHGHTQQTKKEMISTIF